MNYAEAKALAQKINSELLVTGDRFNQMVRVEHMDGSRMMWDGAFCMRYRDEWLFVFTEHHRWHVYHFDDLRLHAEYKRMRESYEEIDISD